MPRSTVRLCRAARICLLLIAATGHRKAQRQQFKQAYKAAQRGQDWRQLAAGLKHYPLYPYLEAAALNDGLRTRKSTGSPFPHASDLYFAS